LVQLPLDGLELPCGQRQPPRLHDAFDHLTRNLDVVHAPSDDKPGRTWIPALVLANVKDDPVVPDEEHLVGHRVEQRTVASLAPFELERGIVAVDLETYGRCNMFDELGIRDVRVTVHDRRELASAALDRRNCPNRTLAIELTMPAVAVRVRPDGVSAPDEQLCGWVVEQAPNARLKVRRNVAASRRSNGCHHLHGCKRLSFPR